jgi:DNA-binding NarL/FixJ family response regulator
VTAGGDPRSKFDPSAHCRGAVGAQTLGQAVTDPSLRILVFDLPPLLRDLVQRALNGNEDITSVVAEASELERMVAETRPDVVIVPLGPEGLQAESRRFLEERSRVRVLGIGLRDGRAALYELRPRRSDLGEVTPDELAETVRAAVARELTV